MGWCGDVGVFMICFYVGWSIVKFLVLFFKMIVFFFGKVLVCLVFGCLIGCWFY